MEIEIVTPAGRKRYLEILYKHLLKQKQDFNQWTLWLNTVDLDDINYCKNLEKKHNWIKTIDLEISFNGNLSIYSFFKHGCNPNKIYIRLDDDIVWMDKNFINELSRFRYSHPEYFLVYPNIINNAIIDHINQRMGSLNIDIPIGYDCFNPVGWQNPQYAEKKHEILINSINNNDLKKFKFKKWILNLYERVSINCISWFGKDFESFNGQVGSDEEQWLSVTKPQELKKYNVIYGKTICSHFAFNSQRDYLDKKTNLLEKYNFLV
jgi:hypothetical protein